VCSLTMSGWAGARVCARKQMFRVVPKAESEPQRFEITPARAGRQFQKAKPILSETRKRGKEKKERLLSSMNTGDFDRQSKETRKD
jgi:hypothetical protein